MKLGFKLGLLTFLVGQAVYAVNTPSGWYGGAMLGPTSSHTVNFTTFNPRSNRVESGQLLYSILGYIGGQVGYRFNQLRAEGEFFFNSAPYHQLTLGGQKFTTSTHTTSWHIKGQTNTGAFMLNGFYDFMRMTDNNVFWVPYVGVGIGYGEINNNVKYYLDKAFIKKTTAKANSPLAQGIIGISYFVDDFFWFSADYRYIASKSLEFFNDGRLTMNAVTISVSGSISCL